MSALGKLDTVPVGVVMLCVPSTENIRICDLKIQINRYDFERNWKADGAESFLIQDSEARAFRAL